ncbi:MAG: EAL domain-containing protein [Thiolinea sp.]
MRKNGFFARLLSLFSSEAEVQPASCLHTLFDALEQCVLFISPDHRVVEINQQAIARSGYAEALLKGADITNVLSFSMEAGAETTHALPVTTPVNHLIDPVKSLTFRGYCQLGHGDKFPALVTTCPMLEGDNYLGTAIAIRDESDPQRLDDIHYNATHDYLTGAYNRFYFGNRLAELLKPDNPDTSVHVIGLVDLDSFKRINYLFGHYKGDEVLIHVVQALRDALGKHALIARQGGDEFVFVIQQSLEEVRQRTGKMLKTLETTPFYHGKHVFHISASIGLSIINPGQDTVSSAISRADQGCYHIKGLGGGEIAVVRNQDAAKMLQSQLNDYNYIDTFRQALKNDRLWLYAQRIVPMVADEDCPERIEILARFSDGQDLIMPGDILPALERGHVMYLFDKSVVRKLTDYIEQGIVSARYVNTNLSPFSLHDQETQQSLITLLQTAKKHGVLITFEITENALLSHLEHIRKITRMIKQHGGKIAIDDFGKGHASYGYIDQLDVDMIKIDGSLISRLADEKIHAIIASIQSVANSVGAVTVAEHVNSAEEKAVLREIGVQYVQSFLESLPYPLIQQEHA